MFSRSLVKAHKVCVLGAAGGIGQPLSLLLKLNDKVSSLSLYDLNNVAGIAADLSHVCTPAKVSFHSKEELKKALDGCDIVLIPAGVPRKPGMTRDQLFDTNASIVRSLAQACAEVCPRAHLAIISNPVNSTVPIAAEVYKKVPGAFDPHRLYGITLLDVLRANTFVADAVHRSPNEIEINVIGGHSGSTIVPLLSQCPDTAQLSEETIKAITHRIQFGGDEVVKAKDGAGSATLSMAVAGARFANSLLLALNGSNPTECAFVVSGVDERVKYFSSRVTLGKEGLVRVAPAGPMNAFEKDLLEKCIPDLIANIKKGEEFVLKA